MASTSQVMAPPQDLLDPATYPHSSELAQRCDLVMKGGIASGVVYPLAVCQLAVTRRVVRVGGSSAGAIAAAAAAAAEYGRDTGRRDAGYPRLAGLPDKLAQLTHGGHTRLYHLFQPQASTGALYRLVAVMIGRGGVVGKVVRASVAAVRALRPLPTVAGVIIPAVLLVLTIVRAEGWGIVAAAILLCLGTLVAVVGSLTLRLCRDLPKNHLGLCSGMRGAGSKQPPLTEWLSDEFDQIADKPEGSGPVTFGDLTARDVELAMLTTDLSAGTQNRLPFRSRVWAFDPREFADLFPERIVEWMVEHPPPAREADREAFDRFAHARLSPMPLAADLPIIVAVRMSLSFPFLLSTIPLYAIDYSAKEQPIVRHRFSDGGITSNFPIHFFDSAIPSQPTFGINLTEVEQLDPDPAANVSMPDSNRAGILAQPKPVETLGQFAGALRNSLQNWSDSMQTRVPGYRDRIVAVKHSKTEGGMNLDMDGDVVLGLTERGRHAGIRADRFDFVNHRWIRLRSLLQTLEELVVPAAIRLDEMSPGPGIPTYREMMAGAPPTAYREPWDPTAGASVADAIVDLGAAYGSARPTDGPSMFEAGAPAPHPRLQVRPKP